MERGRPASDRPNGVSMTPDRVMDDLCPPLSPMLI